MSQDEAIIDLTPQSNRDQLIARIDMLRGLHRVCIVKHRPRRSDRQLRYYFPCFCEPFANWITEEWGEPCSKLDAHEWFKLTFNAVERRDPVTGKVIRIPQSTAKLTTVQFNQYLDNIANFLASYCGIVVPEPSVYHEKDEPADESQGDTAEAVGAGKEG